MSSQEALACQQAWNAYLIITSSNNNWSKSMGFRKNSVLPSRLIRQAKHCLIDWSVFDSAHIKRNPLICLIHLYLNIFSLLPPKKTVVWLPFALCVLLYLYFLLCSCKVISFFPFFFFLSYRYICFSLCTFLYLSLYWPYSSTRC